MATLGAQTEAQLKAVYYAFASFGSGERQVELEGKAFLKLAKDCKLLGKSLTATDVDLIFAKYKNKGQRKLGWMQFMAALEEIAEKKGQTLDAAAQAIISAGGPVDHGTKAEVVRLHDDKTTYTGVYARGGPTNVDADPSNLASVLDRSPANVRGVKTISGGAGSRRSTGDHISAQRRSTAESQASASAASARRSTADTLASSGATARRSTTEALKKLGI